MKLYYKNNFLKEFDEGVSDKEILDWCEENLLPKFPGVVQTKNCFKRFDDKIVYENIVTYTEFILK